MPRKHNSAMGSTMLLALLMAASFWASACFPGEGQRDHNAPKPLRIGIVYTLPHPVLNATIAAFKARMTEVFPDVQFVEAHGSGNKTYYPAVVRQVINQRVDILVPVTTPLSIEALEQANGRIPVVFLAVTDPISAGLVDSLERPGKSSGVSDDISMVSVVDLVRAFMPQAKRIGIPYDPKDPPGVVTANRAELAAKARGFEVQLCPVTSETELRPAVRALSGKVDALVIGLDNLMSRSAGIISETAMDQRKPLFAADDKSVLMGAVAGAGVNYDEVGRLGANIVVKVVKDKLSPGSIPVETLQTGRLFFNRKSIATLNLVVPPEMKDHAEWVDQ